MTEHPDQVPAPLLEHAAAARRVLVLTGAGMSAESGVPTFRDESAGLWHSHSPEVMATEEGWRADPALVWAWYLWRIGIVASTQPNAGHLALGGWQRSGTLERLDIVTQNIDDLHERGGAEVLAHLHGRLDRFHCIDCGLPGDPDLTAASGAPVLRCPPSPCSGCGGDLRPGIVFFNEMLDPTDVDNAVAATQQADLTLVVGTSSVVYPAAALPGLARRSGSFVVEINPHPTGMDCDLQWPTTAALGLPALVEALGLRAQA
ncbi:NAD-dependent deacylase [Arachnia propionica]|uniref:protein acetyllysine N-acetyltransferase n=1 Tax=Arachnia propionica TaxID=1750 RepID=A0A3P1TCS6_9ACTN|nr:NAD-dependent deacylase [Arachnia propionica]MDO5081921.1 NAD-dependent deacylase [Arachnia propionica]RRD07229.1 NAD-dependent deacylase [Arachnia propionica]